MINFLKLVLIKSKKEFHALLCLGVKFKCNYEIFALINAQIYSQAAASPDGNGTKPRQAKWQINSRFKCVASIVYSGKQMAIKRTLLMLQNNLKIKKETSLN
jgi:hypothetical protein